MAAFDCSWTEVSIKRLSRPQQMGNRVQFVYRSMTWHCFLGRCPTVRL